MHTKKRPVGRFLSLVAIGLFQEIFELLCHQRDDLEKIGNDAVGCNSEDRRVFVRVDSNDDLGSSHASHMLDGTGDAAGNIEIGVHGLAGLPNLHIMARVSRVHGGTRSANGGADDVRTLMEYFEIIGIRHGSSAGNNEGSFG